MNEKQQGLFGKFGKDIQQPAPRRTIPIVDSEGINVGSIDIQRSAFQMIGSGYQFEAEGNNFILVPGEAKTKFGSYENSKGIQCCSNCNQKVSKDTFGLSKCNVIAGIKVFEYLIDKPKGYLAHTSEMKKLTESEYCNLRYLVRFGLAYKSKEKGKKKGFYGMNRGRFKSFLDGKATIAESCTRDPTQKYTDGLYTLSEKRITIDQVKDVNQIKEETGGHFTTFHRNHEFE